MKHYEVSVMTSTQTAPVDLKTAGERTGLHPDFICELVQVHMVSTTLDDCFDDRALARLHQIAELRFHQQLPIRTVRMIIRLVDRLEDAEAELRYLRELSR